MKIRELGYLTLLVALGAVVFSIACNSHPPSNGELPTPLPVDSSKVDPYEKFKPLADRFTKPPTMVRLATTGYVVKGKAVQYELTIDRDDKEKNVKPQWRLDTLIQLQDMVPPEKVEDVATVILRKCEEVQSASYGLIGAGEVVGNDIKGFGWKCEITVIDKSIPAVIARKTFEVKPPEATSVSEKKRVVTTIPPITEMQDYLKSLERK